MLTIKELSKLIFTLSVDDFEKQLGPFVLIQHPPSDDALRVGLKGVEVTHLRNPNAILQNMLALLFQFENLRVTTLPPLRTADALSIGRLPDCDLVTDDPSVSKRHAVLRWNANERRCTVEDLQSTNGTFLNASIRLKSEIELRDGDIVSFGDAQYWFLLTPTLHTKLRSASFVGPRSG